MFQGMAGNSRPVVLELVCIKERVQWKKGKASLMFIWREHKKVLPLCLPCKAAKTKYWRKLKPSIQRSEEVCISSTDSLVKQCIFDDFYYICLLFSKDRANRLNRWVCYADMFWAAVYKAKTSFLSLIKTLIL